MKYQCTHTVISFKKESSKPSHCQPTSTDVELTFYMTIIFLNIKPSNKNKPYTPYFLQK